MVNTLVLSVFERTREIGMLRAVGVSRRQVRRMIRHESVITALIGAALGLPLGVLLAAILTRGTREPGHLVPRPVHAARDLHRGRRDRRDPRCGSAGTSCFAAQRPRSTPIRIDPASWRLSRRERSQPLSRCPPTLRPLKIPLKGTLAMTHRLFIPIAVLSAIAALLLANTASATPPTTAQMPADYSQTPRRRQPLRLRHHLQRRRHRHRHHLLRRHRPANPRASTAPSPTQSQALAHALVERPGARSYRPHHRPRHRHGQRVRLPHPRLRRRLGPKRSLRLRRYRPHHLHRPKQPRHNRPLRSPLVMTVGSATPRGRLSHRKALSSRPSPFGGRSLLDRDEGPDRRVGPHLRRGGQRKLRHSRGSVASRTRRG